jgi:hypothetical protein
LYHNGVREFQTVWNPARFSKNCEAVGFSAPTRIGIQAGWQTGIHPKILGKIGLAWASLEQEIRILALGAGCQSGF